jgi:CMP-2-keto-3-deoxyoctulosonic acid synthetase
MSNKIIAIIPARYESSRFPGKPLAIINGKPMIQRVYEQTSKAFNDVCVATDDMRIFETVEKFGGKAIMTSKSHRSGTDRCLEAYYKYIGNNKNNSDIVINVQGDEPYIHPEQLCELSNCFNDDNIQIATLVKKYTLLKSCLIIIHPR